MQITGGKVAFKRSYQPEQYGSKGADVEITFTLQEGEELGAQLDHVGNLVKAQVLRLCNIKTEALGNAPADVVKAGTITGTTIAPKDVVVGTVTPKPETTKPPKGRTKSDLEAEKIAAAGGTTPPKSEAASAPAKDQAAEPEQSEGEDIEGFNEDDTPAPEISDVELSSAMNATVARLDPTNGKTTAKLIKALIQTFKPHDFSAAAQFKSAQIPQALRKQFLEKLKTL